MYLKMNTLNLFSLFLNLIFCYYQPQPLFSKIPASFLFFFPLIQIVFSLNDFHHSLHGSSIQMLFHITQFFFSFIFIGWRLITLQYCSGFCHTLTWISHGFTCVPHPDPPATSLSTRFLWVFPMHQARALVSCIQPELVICFTLDNILFGAVLSKHPTLAFSHRVQKSVLYICVSFSVLHIGLLLPSF